MKSLLLHTAKIYLLATGISLFVAVLIKLIERAVRPRPLPAPVTLTPESGRTARENELP